jgi:hypothetical protein
MSADSVSTFRGVPGRLLVGFVLALVAQYFIAAAWQIVNSLHKGPINYIGRQAAQGWRCIGAEGDIPCSLTDVFGNSLFAAAYMNIVYAFAPLALTTILITMLLLGVRRSGQHDVPQ